MIATHFLRHTYQKFSSLGETTNFNLTSDPKLHSYSLTQPVIRYKCTIPEDLTSLKMDLIIKNDTSMIK